MTDFTIHTKKTAPVDSHALMDAAQEKFGFVPNVLAGLAEAPASLKGYMTLAGILGESSLSPAEQQVILLSASRENACQYCVAAHTGGAKKAAVDDEVINGIRDGAHIPDEKLRALSAFATAIVAKQGWVDKDDLDLFFAAGYQQQQVLEVILAIGVKTISNYANHIIQTPLDKVFEPFAWAPNEAS